MDKMNLPGFTAELSLYKPTRYYSIAKALLHDDMAVYPAQSAMDWTNLLRNRKGPYYVWPDFCPPGSRLVLVKTGGEEVCLRWVEGDCVAKGTPFEKCWPPRCINWQTTLIEYHWECQSAFRVAT